jgi:hypothetical protein
MASAVVEAAYIYCQDMFVPWNLDMEEAAHRLESMDCKERMDWEHLRCGLAAVVKRYCDASDSG